MSPATEQSRDKIVYCKRHDIGDFSQRLNRAFALAVSICDRKAEAMPALSASILEDKRRYSRQTRKRLSSSKI
jgi:uncharacterized protein YecT (DUF1311 family)